MVPPLRKGGSGGTAKSSQTRKAGADHGRGDCRNTERDGWETVLDRRRGARADIQGDWRHVQRLVRLQDAKALGVLPQGAGKAARAQAARRGDRQVPEGARRTDTEEDRGGLHGGRAGRDNRYRRRPAQKAVKFR